MPNRCRLSYRAIARSGLVALVLSLALLVSVKSGLVPWLVQICNQNPYGNGSEQCAAYAIIYAPFVYLGNFLNNEYGVIAALAGATVAWYTYTLRNSTDRLWRSSEEGLHAVERAFVYVKMLQTEAIPVHPLRPHDIKEWRIMVTWGNSGRTPTRHLVNHVSWHAFENGMLPENFDFPDIWSSGDPRRYNKGFLGPNAEMHTVVVSMDATELSMIYEERKAIYIWGWADYNDVFKDTPRRRTEFCTVVDLHEGGGKAGGKRLIYRIHEEFNGADEECYRAPQPYPPQPSSA